MEKRYIHKNGSVIHANITVTLVEDENDKPDHFITVTEDITEKKKSEKKLVDTQKYLRSIIESSMDMICASDIKGKITEFNKAAQMIFGYTQEEIIGKHVSILYAKEKKHVSVRKKLLEGKGEYAGEIINKRKNGEEFITYLSASVIKDENENVLGIMGVSRDITKVKDSELKLKESLLEKEILLKEIHHRVKNNLQIILSMLNLQTSYIREKKTVNILKSSYNRIRSMALIHEMLYPAVEVSNINFSEYIRKLMKNLIVYFPEAKKGKIDLDLKIENSLLNFDNAVPCGLIINELVTNSLKHAFPKKNVFEGKKKKISIKFTAKDFKNGSDDVMTLLVSDNVIGIPKGINCKNTDSFGLQLVNILIEQLNGSIEIDRKVKKGTKYKIVFQQKNQ